MSKNSKINVAIKVVDTKTMHLLSSAPKSLLLKQQKVRENANCEKCEENAFDNLAEVQFHFKNLHQMNVNIRDIIVDEKNESDENASSEFIELEQDTYRCNLCENNSEMVFDSDEKLIKHTNEIHVPNNQAQLQCPKCLQFFKNQSSFRKHQADHYKGTS